MAIKLIGVD